MLLNELRNTVRNWFRSRVASIPALAELELLVPNEGGALGQDETWMRLTIQTGETSVVGIGAEQKRRRRLARVFIEVFGATDVGDGKVTRIAEAVEKIWRDAMVASAAPHPDIRVNEPSSFERNEPGRYCQVVSVPIEVDHIS